MHNGVQHRSVSRQVFIKGLIKGKEGREFQKFAQKTNLCFLPAKALALSSS